MELKNKDVIMGGMDSFQASYDAMMDFVEHSLAIGLNASRFMVDKGARQMGDVVKNGPKAMTSASMTAMINEMVSVSGKYFDLGRQTSERMQKAADQFVSSARTGAEDAFEQVASKAPAGTENIVKIVRSSIGATSSAVERTGKVVRAMSKKAEDSMFQAVNAAQQSMKSERA